MSQTITLLKISKVSQCSFLSDHTLNPIQMKVHGSVLINQVERIG